MGWLSLILKLSLTQDLCARSLHGNLGLIRGAHIALSRASKDDPNDSDPETEICASRTIPRYPSLSFT
jgi:hypothetical protein